MKRFYFAILAAAFALSLGGDFALAATPSMAAAKAPTRCRDKMGKFIKCPTVKPMPKRCRDKMGKFTKCK